MRLATAGLCAVVLAASVGQGSQIAPRLPRRPVTAVTGAETGLFFRLSEGAEAPERRQPPAPAAPLDDAAARRVLDRLPPLPPDAGDRIPFAFRPRSLPPPRAGVTVTQSFPPPAAPEGGPPVSGGGPLTVLRRSPEGNVPLASHLSVTFSQPMVPVGSHEELAAAGVPVSLTPQPEGKWRWVGTRTLLFEPRLRFPMATEYRASAVGVQWTFTTPPPSLTVKHPADVTARPDTLIFAAFDQAIDPAAMVRFVRVTAGQGLRDVRLATAEEVQADPEVKALAEKAGQGRWLAFRAVSPLPPDSGVTVEIAVGAPSAEGPRVTTEAQRWGFRTFGPLRVVRHQCAWGNNECPPGAPWQVELSNALDAAAFKKEMVRVAPELPGLQVSVHGATLVVQGRSRPRTAYAVTLAGALADVFGQTLGQDQTVRFTVGRAQPSISAAGETITVLDPAGGSRLSVYSAGVVTLEVIVHRVTPSDWATYRSFLQTALRDRTLPPVPGTRISTRRVPVAGLVDELVETAVDLREAFPGGLGHAIVVVTPADVPLQSERWPGRVIRWVQSTRIGLDAFVDERRLLAWATSLADGRPLAGVEVALAPAGAVARTDADGLASLELSGSPRGLVARAGNDVAFLPANQSWWAGDAGWTRVYGADRLRWMVFDDRGLYRPGEEARVKGWIRLVGRGPTGDVELAPASVQSVDYVLRDAQNNEIAKGRAAVSPAGGFDLALPLPATMNLGPAALVLTTAAPGVEGLQHHHALQVQEFRRPEFEVGTEASTGPHLVGGSATVSVRAAYFAGGPLPDAPVTWTVRSTTGQFTPPGRDDYVCGEWVPWWGIGPGSHEEREETFESRTDAAGRHVLKIDFDRVTPPRASQVAAEASVADVNRQEWTSTALLLVHPANVYVGLRAPRMFVQKGERLDVDAIVVDLDGKVATGRSATLALERLAWEQVAGEWTQVPSGREECPVTAAEEPSRCTFRPKDGGSYRVTATTADAEGRPNQTVMSLWVAGGEQPPRRDVAQEEVTLVPARKDFRAGDVAEILVLAPFADAEGLLTLRRSGLVRSERFRIQGSSHTLRIPIEDAYVPNVHVQVDLVGRAPRLRDDGTPDPKLPPRPAFASGTIDLAVPPLERALTIAVAARDAALEPGGKTDLTLDVKNAAGRPVAGAELAVVVVDEAVLALTAYKVPDPLEVFYAKREPGVQDHHSRTAVTLERPDDLDLLSAPPPPAAPQPRMRAGVAYSRAKGGVEEVTVTAEAPMVDTVSSAVGNVLEETPIALRADFRALALFAPSVTTDAAGRAVVPVTLPESLTRYRVTAVAVSGGRQFGKGESTITARLPLMVRPSPPRFLNFGDTFALPVVVQNQTDAPMSVDVAVRATNATLTAGAGRRVTVPANDRVEVLFPAAASEAGTARFQVGASSGRWADAAQIALPVWTPATTEAFATYGQIDSGAMRQPIQAPRDVIPQFGGLEVTTSSTALSALTDAVLYLVAYPFECAEQVSSRVISIAALKDVLTAFQAKGLPPPDDLKAAMDRDIAFLVRLQNDDGGFAFWRRGDPSWPFVSLHAAHALQWAKDKGFTVPAPALPRAQGYLKDIERHIPREYGPEVRRTIAAYALHVRARMGDRDPGKARALFREAGLEKLSFESLGWLLPLLDAADAAAVVRHLENRVTETAAAAHFAVSYGEQAYLILHSDRRADAVVLDGLIATRPQSDLIPKIVTGLLAGRRGGRWENTQENVFVLLALDRYFATYEKTTPDFVARVWLGDQYAGEHAFRGRTTERHQVDVPMAQVLSQGAGDLVIAKDGAGRLYYRVGMSYAPKSLTLAPADHGFTVERAYEGVDDPADVRRNADGSWRIKAGARVRVRLTMVAPARRYHVALVDPLPAGLEAMNPALATTGALPPAPPVEGEAGARPWWWWPRTWYEHQNLRDERVEAFTALLWEGVHRYDYVARATTPGAFVVPPPKAEEMYHPETFGRGGTDRVIVE
jgi:alpha-2-macroglobulin